MLEAFCTRSAPISAGIGCPPPCSGLGRDCWRQLTEWHEADVWRQLREHLLAEPRAVGLLDLSAALIVSTHMQALKGWPHGSIGLRNCAGRPIARQHPRLRTACSAPPCGASATALRGVLDRPHVTAWSGTTIGRNESHDGLWLRLTATDSRVCRIKVHADVPPEVCDPVAGVVVAHVAGRRRHARPPHHRRPESDDEVRWESGAIGRGPAAN